MMASGVRLGLGAGRCDGGAQQIRGYRAWARAGTTVGAHREAEAGVHTPTQTQTALCTLGLGEIQTSIRASAPRLPSLHRRLPRPPARPPCRNAHGHHCIFTSSHHPPPAQPPQNPPPLSHPRPFARSSFLRRIPPPYNLPKSGPPPRHPVCHAPLVFALLAFLSTSAACCWPQKARLGDVLQAPRERRHPHDTSCDCSRRISP